jgi:predicted nucleic acid-binding protein
VWGTPSLRRAAALCRRYEGLALGLVDVVVAATAKRLKAEAIATVDLRDFAPLELVGRPRLDPRELG